VAAHLTGQLIRRGHEVTLFASGDLTVETNTKCTQAAALRAAALVPWGNSLHLPMVSEVFDSAGHFDVIHCHLDYWSFPFGHFVATPTVTTLALGRQPLGNNLLFILHNEQDCIRSAQSLAGM
jgi:hypothetical protein